MGRYNPNYPTVLGNEFAPVTVDPVAIDTASAVGYTFRTATRDDIGTARVLMTAPPPGQPYRKVITCEVYPDAVAPATGVLRKITVPCVTASSYSNATVVGGGTFADALRNPTDGKYVALTGPSAGVKVWFDTSTSNTRLHAAVASNRIVDVTVKYAMTGEFEDHAVPVVMALERSNAAVSLDMDNTITGEAAQYENVVPRSSRLGDYNPFWNTTINPNTDARRGPWKLANGSNNFIGLEAMASAAGTNFNLRFITASTVTAGVAAFALHYCALEITYCAENRVAAGGLDLTGGVGLEDDMFYADVPLFSPPNWGFLWDSNTGYDYMLAVGQGYVGALSVTYPVPVTLDRVVSARDTFKGHRGVLINKTLRAGEEWTREETESLPAVALYASTVLFDGSTIYTPSQVYNSPLSLEIAQLTFPGDSLQWVSDGGVAGRTYTHVRFYARNTAATTDYLEVYVTNVSDVPQGPSARISVEEFAALPEIVNGWKEVTLPLDPVWVTPGFGIVKWQFQSATGLSAPWEVLGADANPYREAVGAGYGSATYHDVTGFARVDGVNDFNADLSLMLIAALDVPGNLAVSTAVQALTVLDEACGVPVSAIPTGIRYHQLSWDAVNDLAVAGFAYYEVQRRDTTMPADEWETIAEITSVTVTAMDDYEARVGVVSSYRIRQVHEDGYTSEWSATVTSTIVAPGVTGTGVDSSVLILTTNHNPSGNLAYVTAYEGRGGVPEQDFTFPEGGQTGLQSMYGRDYRVAFRPLERAGTEFTRTLLLNAAGVPTLTADKTALALRDLAWDTVPYVCTRDERNNRWLTSVSVPGSATRDVPSAGHLVLAPATFTEVTGTPAPVDYEGGCEGLRLEGADTYQYWSTLAPAVMGGTRVQTDTFTRVVANGWGSSDTGEAWTTGGGGAAADYAVNGTVGQIISATVTVDRRQIAADTYSYHRAKISMTVPAVATGGAFHAGLITRYQDANNFFYYKVEFGTGGTFRLDVVKVLAGVVTTVDTGAVISTYTAGTVIHLEEMTRGNSLTVRVWKNADAPPDWESGGAAVAFLPAQTGMAMTGKVGVQQTRLAANTNANITLTYDNFTVDSLPEVYDIRALVRPFADNFIVQYGTDNSSTVTDTEGTWALELAYGAVGVNIVGTNSTQIDSTKVLELGLVKNHRTWVRAVITQDTGSGAEQVQFYTLATDGVTWTLIDTVTAAAPTQPIPPLNTGGLMSVMNVTPGGIWTERMELRLDGVLVMSPDFTAQAIGAEDFTDAQGNDWSTTSGRGICATLE